MCLIDEGELSSGLQRETLEDTEAAIHPPSHLHTPKPSAHTLEQTKQTGLILYAGRLSQNTGARSLGFFITQNLAQTILL